MNICKDTKSLVFTPLNALFFVILYIVMERCYNDYGHWIRQQFPFRTQKIAIDAGFSCPNRDGKISYGGCTFCDNRTFNPAYCSSQKSIRQQIAEGRDFFAQKYPDMKYLAYFQAFSNTYAPVERLKEIYEEALSEKDIVGIVIGTRPDCVSDDLLNYLEQLNRQTFLIIEYGVESTSDETLRHINRGHDFACARQAINKTHERGILVGAHIILGFPGETQAQILQQARLISSLPINILKLHQLQIIKGTVMARQYLQEPFPIYSVDEYISLIGKYIQYLRKDIVLERFTSQSPAEMLLAPKWGLKNYEFTNLLDNYLRANGIRQGLMAE